MQQRVAGPAGRARDTGTRRDAAAPALRLPDPQAALRPLHPGGGRAGLRRRRRSSSCEVCEAWTANSGRERTTALVYSVGWTQHSVGVQYIRTGAIIQLLLGNMGRPGGGIMALRGHASIQGSTDIPTLFNLLPGYLPMPHAHAARDAATSGSTSIRPRTRRASGPTRTRTRSACSRRTGATRRRPRTTSASTTCPGSPATTAPTAGARHDRRQDQGLLPARPEPGRRLGARQGAAPRHGQPRLAGRPRPAR